jgi:hypothetical protein
MRSVIAKARLDRGRVGTVPPVRFDDVGH